MSDKIYTLEELRAIVKPIAEKYRIPTVYVYGSYARGEANTDSDVDLLVDLTGAKMDFPFAIGALYGDFEDTLKKKIDLVTVASLEQDKEQPWKASFRYNLQKERVVLYATS